MYDDDLRCVFSGRYPTPEALVQDADDDDDMDDCPLGWIRVTVERRGYNPAYLALQHRKARLVAQGQAQIPRDAFKDDKGHVDEAEYQEALHDIAFAVAAQIHPVEADTPRYVTVQEVRYVADPDAHPQVADAWAGVAEGLDVTIGMPAEAPDAPPTPADAPAGTEEPSA